MSLQEEEDDSRSGKQLETGLSRLLKGTNQYFVCLVADTGLLNELSRVVLLKYYTGYVYLPKNMPKDQLLPLSEFAENHGMMFLAPAGRSYEKILHLGTKNYFCKP